MLPKVRLTLAVLPKVRLTLVVLPQYRLTLAVLPKVRLTLAMLPKVRLTLAVLPQVRLTPWGCHQQADPSSDVFFVNNLFVFISGYKCTRFLDNTDFPTGTFIPDQKTFLFLNLKN